MNSPLERKLVGINGWFMIEILSFYGYILSAMAFLIESSLRSEFASRGGYVDTRKTECYKADFINYFRKDLDWLAFVTILFTVNIGLIAIDNNIVFSDEASRQGKEFPLRKLTYLLLANHFL